MAADKNPSCAAWLNKLNTKKIELILSHTSMMVVFVYGNGLGSVVVLFAPLANIIIRPRTGRVQCY